MKLNDIRRLTIKQKLRVTFPLSNGMDCIVDEHGISRIPKLGVATGVNIEDELAAAAKFVVEVAGASKEKGGGAKARNLSRAELESMAASTSSAAPSSHEHEE